jgi:hypothetical protein
MARFCGSVQANAGRARSSLEETLANSNGPPILAKRKKEEVRIQRAIRSKPFLERYRILLPNGG